MSLHAYTRNYATCQIHSAPVIRAKTITKIATSKFKKQGNESSLFRSI